MNPFWNCWLLFSNNNHRFQQHELSFKNSQREENKKRLFKWDSGRTVSDRRWAGWWIETLQEWWRLWSGLPLSLSCGSLRGSFITWFVLFWKKEAVNSGFICWSEWRDYGEARRNKTLVVSGFNFIFNHIRSIVA